MKPRVPVRDDFYLVPLSRTATRSRSHSRTPHVCHPRQNIPVLIAATIATEDKDFYEHPGFDAVAILRFVGKLSHRRAGRRRFDHHAAARALLLSPEERAERTYSRKAREIILAAEITRRYSKDDILGSISTRSITAILPMASKPPQRRISARPPTSLTWRIFPLAGLPQSPPSTIFTPTATSPWHASSRSWS